jgi:ABC-type multidrug transport system fused ATPase/permease subunit
VFSFQKNLAAKTLIGTVFESFRLLEKSDRTRVASVALIHLILGFFDILAIFLIGLVGSLAVTGISSSVQGKRTNQILQLLAIETNSLQFQVTVLGLIAALALTAKSILSLYLTKKSLFFLARRSAGISQKLIAKLFNQELLYLRVRSTQESIYALTRGVQVIATNIIASTLILAADFFLIVTLSISLFFVDTLIAVSSLILFLGTGIALYLRLHKRAKLLGELSTKLEIASNSLISDVLANYRELFVRNQRSNYAEKIGLLRMQIAESGAHLGYMALLSKYVMEITLVFGGILIGAAQFITQPASRAVAAISVFLVASVRIAPAILRVQTSFINIRNSIGLAGPTLKLMQELEAMGTAELDIGPTPKFSELMARREGFKAEILIKEANFFFPSRYKTGVINLDLVIKSGQFVGIVGPSGAGKTTLVDLFLGLLTPSSGEVLLSGMNPKIAITRWPGAVSYVPQDVSIIDGSIKENICLGFDANQVNDDVVEDVLHRVGLGEILSRPLGIHSRVGERGSNLSGGQRQRIGIARGLLTNPRLLILDEATSALDALTEEGITEQLESMKGKITLVVVAHRLSTIRKADNIVYLDAGRIRGQGTFDELRVKLPEFEKQVENMGL